MRFSRIPFCRGVVIGIFWGWMPMFFQMIPAAYCAILFRANLPLSVAGVWISNPITMPPMRYFAYLFGNYILNIDPVYEKFQLNTEWIMSAMSNIWEPLLVGTLNNRNFIKHNWLLHHAYYLENICLIGD